MKKRIIFILTILLSITLLFVSFCSFVTPSQKALIKRNCDIDIMNGVIEKYDYREEDDITKYHYFTVKYSGDRVDDITEQLLSNDYGLNFFITDVSAPWWPESEDYYCKYGPNKILGIIWINTCATTTMVQLSEDGDTYLYIGCMELGNMWHHAGIA